MEKASLGTKADAQVDIHDPNPASTHPITLAR